MTTPDIDIKLSIKDAVVDVLEDDSLWTNAWNVYYESNMPTYTDTNEPSWPYVFVISDRVPQEPRWLPVIVLEIIINDDEWQLGTLSRFAVTRLHLLCSSEGQASRLRTVLADNLDIIEVFDYSGETPSKLSDSSFVDDWTAEPVALSNQILMEGSLRHWLVMENTLVVM
jgi:hypothetical protein